MKTRTLLATVAGLAGLAVTGSVTAQGTAFTYQGRLYDGPNAANGLVDLTFRLWTAASGPAQVGDTRTNAAVAVSNGLFTVALDFGSSVFDGSDRWLEIGVRTNGGGAFTSLSPRQRLTPTPYAIRAANAASAATASSVAWAALTGMPAGFADGVDDDTIYTAGAGLSLSGTMFSIAGGGVGASQLADNAVTSAKILDGTIVNADLSATAAISDTKLATIATAGKVANSSTTATSANMPNAIVARDASGNFGAGAVTATSFNGGGAGLTDLNAGQLTSGTVADARLSANVALLNANQTYTGNVNFSPATAGIGVGTTSPETALDVRGSLTAQVPGGGNNDNLVVKKTGAVGTSNAKFILSHRTTGRELWLYGTDGVSGFRNLQSWDYGNNAVRFPANGQTLYVDHASGRVGIGTATPAEPLHVAGQVRISGGSPAQGKVLTSDADGTARWSLPRAGPQVVVVDASGGGDYTTISAALSAVTPSAANPVTIEVRPGNYLERVVMKSHVHLRGAGASSTAILFNPAGATLPADFAVVRMNNLTNVALNGLTLASRNYTNSSVAPDNAVGVFDQSSSPVVREVRITALGGSQPVPLAASAFGMVSVGSSPVVEDCVFAGVSADDAISLLQSSARICGNSFSNHWHAVTLDQSSATILMNTLLNLGEAIWVKGSASSATIANNIIRATSSSDGIRNEGEARILGNLFLGPLQHGVNNTGPAIISGNLFSNSAFRAVSDTGSTRSAITANRFVNCGGGGERALYLAGSSSVVIGNVFTGSPFGDMTVSGGSPIINNNVTTGAVGGSPTLASHGPVNLTVSSTSNLQVNATGLFEVNTRAHLRGSPSGTGLFVTSTGSVGIGKTNPAATLDVSGNIAASGSVDAGTQFLGQSADTASTPSFSWTSDANTGLFRPAADTVALSTSGAERLRINSSGQVGIGTTTPATPLHVQTPINEDVAIRMNSGGSWSLIMNQSPGSVFTITNGGQARLTMPPDGKIGIGRTPTANALEVAGNASKDAAGSWLANSDARIKQDIQPVQAALEKLDQVRLVSFRYTEDYQKTHPGVEDRRYLNVVAQEFARVFPDHVKSSGETTPDGSNILQVDTYPLTIYSAAAIQELNRELKQKQTEIAELKQTVAELKQLVATINHKLNEGNP